MWHHMTAWLCEVRKDDGSPKTKIYSSHSSCNECLFFRGWRLDLTSVNCGAVPSFRWWSSLIHFFLSLFFAFAVGVCCLKCEWTRPYFVHMGSALVLIDGCNQYLIWGLSVHGPLKSHACCALRVWRLHCSDSSNRVGDHTVSPRDVPTWKRTQLNLCWAILQDVFSPNSA